MRFQVATYAPAVPGRLGVLLASVQLGTLTFDIAPVGGPGGEMATRSLGDSAVSASLAVRWGLLPSRSAPPVSRTSDVVRNDLLGTLVASSSRIVSVIAPGGYGKSTLLAQFAEQRSSNVGVAERGGDADDPVTLARYLVFALGPDFVDRRGSAARARWPPSEDADRHCRARRRDRRGRRSVRPHRRRSPSAHGSTLLRPVARPRSGSPVGIQDRVRRPVRDASRAGACSSRGGATRARDRRPAVRRRRRSRSACELRAPAMSARRTSLRLTDRTEGWAVGLYLAARSLAANPATAPTFGGHDRDVADYLRETMLADLPASEVEFLIQSSVLEELSGPLCDATLATTGSGAMLETLESSNLLVVPLDRRRDRYRYHHLFRDLLRMELEHRAPELVAGAHRARIRLVRNGGSDGPGRGVRDRRASRRSRRRADRPSRQATYLGGRASVVRAWIEWFGEHGELDRFPAVAVIGAWFHVGGAASPRSGTVDRCDSGRRA